MKGKEVVVEAMDIRDPQTVNSKVKQNVKNPKFSV